MDIVKLRKYEDGLTQAEEDALLEKEGLRRLTPDEFFDDCRGNEFTDFLPCRLKTPKGLLQRGDNNGGRRYVYAISRPSARFGVLGVKREKETTDDASLDDDKTVNAAIAAARAAFHKTMLDAGDYAPEFYSLLIEVGCKTDVDQPAYKKFRVEEV